MKYKVPKIIKIGAQWVEIKCERGLGELHGKRGQARIDQCEIAIDQEGKDSIKTATLIHEILHFIDDVYNSYRFEDYEVQALANGIAILLDDLGIELDWSNWETKENNGK